MGSQTAVVEPAPSVRRIPDNTTMKRVHPIQEGADAIREKLPKSSPGAARSPDPRDELR